MGKNTYLYHTVKQGETLTKISSHYKVSAHKIVQTNPEIKIIHQGIGKYKISDLQEGQILRIPKESASAAPTQAYRIKRGVKAITGNSTPQAGVKETYRVSEWYPGTPENQRDSTKVKWAVYYKKEGKYILKLQKEIGEFTFYEQAIGKDIKVVGYLYSPELDNESSLSVKVIPHPTPMLSTLMLYDINKDKPLPRHATLKLGQSLYVVAHTTASVGKKVKFLLLRKEEKNSEEHYIPEAQSIEPVCSQGTATAVFYLDDWKYLNSAPNKQKYKVQAFLENKEDDKSPGQKVAIDHSPVYKGYTPLKGGWNKLSEDFKKLTNYKYPQIQRVSLYIPENKTKISYGEYIKLKIEGKYLKGQNVEYTVYEDDNYRREELDAGIVQMQSDEQEVTLQLTQEMYKKGGTDWYELMDGKHEIFVSLKLKGKTQIQSTGIIEVDTTTMTMETIPGNRAVTTGKPDRKEEKKEKCVCKEYDLIWGAKVSCEFRMKVVKICKELWPSNYLNMANNLMAVMAWEIGETFSPSIKNPNSSATGLIQFMKNTAEELGTTVDKLEKMTALEQLDYVKKYFYPQRNKKLEFVDFYLQVLFPASMGKPDNHVVFSKDGRGLDKNDRNYSLRIKAYPVNKGFDTNPKYGNNDGMVTKAEIKKGIQKYIDKGEINKTTIFNCGVKVEKDIKKKNIIKWHDPVDNPRRTKYNSNGNIKPVNGAYGNVRNGYTKYHSGLDLFALPYIKDEYEGTKIYACLDGIVTNTAAGPQAGKAIRLKINNVKDLLEQEKKVNYKLEFNKGEEMGINIKETDTVYFIYLHLSRVLVKNNQTVKAGDIIGYTGVSGSIATNIPSPHLHLEIATIENAYGTGKTRRTNPARFIKLNSYNTKDQDDAVNYKYSENGYKSKWNAPKKDQTKD